MPFITYWKGHIEPKVSDAIVCQMDLMASLGNLVGINEVETDSQNLLNSFLGKTDKGRDHLILEANSNTALRSGDWILIPPYKGPDMNKKVGVETGISPEYSLFNVKKDAGQRINLANENPEKLKEMIRTFENLKK